MIINGVKITLVVCFTVMLAFILHIAYLEYVDRYTIIYTPDNAVFIFDKKTTIMSRYANGACQLIDTKLPNTGAGMIMHKAPPVFPEIQQQQMIHPAPIPLPQAEQFVPQQINNQPRMMPYKQQPPQQPTQPMR